MLLFVPEEVKLYKEKMEKITDEAGHKLCPERKTKHQPTAERS